MRWNVILLIICVVAAAPASATEVYRWVDENGVVHFSQNAPGDVNEKVEIMELDDSVPPGYDPEEDLYNVEALAEEMNQLREEMAEKRALAKEQQQENVQHTVVHYQPAVEYGYPWYGLSPGYPQPRPPLRPRPPRPEPMPSLPFRPPGGNR